MDDAIQLVSIHAPGRGATCERSLCPSGTSCFNSRTREGCDRRDGSRQLLLLRFNSRTREGCDLQLMRYSVSAPVFQFTHPGGVRLQYLGLWVWSHLFQFTHPGGVRHLLEASTLADEVVSIHAPGRGATYALARCGFR